MEFGVLGPLRVIADGGAIPLGPPRERAALALLLVSAPEPVSRDEFVDQLWGERPPPSAEHAVHVYMAGIRKRLCAGGAAVCRGASGYSLDVDAEQVDARRFQRLVTEARHSLAGDAASARASYRQALELWRGRPLAEFGQFEFARREADRLEEVHAVAVVGLAEAALECGEHDEVISLAAALARAHPLRERPRRLMMLALYRNGRHAEALAAYRDACAALHEVGLRPGPELRALEAAILRHDETLTARRGGAGPPERLDPAPAPPSRRKIVTVLCCDVAASTASGDELDPEALLAAMHRWLGEADAIVERHGGTAVTSIGDAMLAVFGIPRVHEDDALRALRAAAEIRARLPGVAKDAGVALSFRAAVNTGLVLAVDGQTVALGNAVNVAARLEQSARPGEILLDHETLVLARDAVEVEATGPLSVPGKAEPMPAFRLSAVDPLAPGTARHPEPPFVGREPELTRLRLAFDRAVSERECHLLTVLGTPGVGKTRLVTELLASLADRATALRGRCLPYGEGITFRPIIEALRPLGDAARDVLARIHAGGVATPAELFWEIRRLLDAVAAERPVILHVDDLQWAEPMLLDLIDHLAELSHGVPMLLLCTARPELLEDHPAWGARQRDSTTFLMDALGAPACERLLDELGDESPRHGRAEMIAASGGNPLFLEQIAALARERDGPAIPATIHALLAARLERLASDERDVLECAAVEGNTFHVDAVGELGARTGADVDAVLACLVRKDLIRPQASRLDDLETCAFRHILIRDVAYDAATKATRARLHERLANWLERRAPRLPEADELVGRHLERTVGYRRELGARADPALASRAAEHLHTAGRRAAQRGDTLAALKLLERAYRLLPEDARIASELADQLMEGDDLARVDSLLSVAERDPATADHAALGRLHWLTLTAPARAPDAIEAVLPELLERLAAAGDESGVAKAYLVSFWAVSQRAVRLAAAAEQARVAAAHARNAGDLGLRSRALALYVAALIHGPKTPPALAAELDALEVEELGPYVGALVTVARGEVERLEGRLERARALMREGIGRFRAMRIHTMMASCLNWLAWAELSGGDPGAALPGLLEADEVLAMAGERSFRATGQATLAEVCERLGETDRARAAVRLAEELVAPDDHLTLVGLCVARARLALYDHDREAAEGWARKAVAHAYRMDVLFLRGTAQLALAEVLSDAGRGPEAQSAARAALELFQAKGDRPRAAQAQAFLARPR